MSGWHGTNQLSSIARLKKRSARRATQGRDLPSLNSHNIGSRSARAPAQREPISFSFAHKIQENSYQPAEEQEQQSCSEEQQSYHAGLAGERPAKRPRQSGHTVQEMQAMLSQSSLFAAKSPRTLFASRSHMRRRKSEEEPFQIVPTASLLAPLVCTYTPVEDYDGEEMENLDGSDMEMSEDDGRPSTSHTHLSLTAISDMASPGNSTPEVETPFSFSPIPGKEDDFDYLRAIAVEMDLPFPENRFQDPPKLSYRVPLPFEDKLACSWTAVDEPTEIPGEYAVAHWRFGLSAANEADVFPENSQVSDEVMQTAVEANEAEPIENDLWDEMQDQELGGSSPLSSAASSDDPIMSDIEEEKESTPTSVYSSASEGKPSMKQTTLHLKPRSPSTTLRVNPYNPYSSKTAKLPAVAVPSSLSSPSNLLRPQTRQHRRNLFAMHAGPIDMRSTFANEKRDSD